MNFKVRVKFGIRINHSFASGSKILYQDDTWYYYQHIAMGAISSLYNGPDRYVYADYGRGNILRSGVYTFEEIKNENQNT